MIPLVEPHIRVECVGLEGHKGQVTFVDCDGVETDISSSVTDVSVKIGVNSVNTATLTVLLGSSRVDAQVTDIIANLIREVNDNHDPFPD